MTTITSNGSLTSVGDECFYGCESLNSIDLGDNLLSIGRSCFKDCTSLSLLKLGEQVNWLGEYCLENCLALTKNHSRNSNPPVVEYNRLGGGITSSINLYVPEGNEDIYKQTKPWSQFYIIPVDFSGVETIGADGQEGTEAEVWYTPSGVRVDKPEHGVYIRVRGSKSERLFIP